MGHRAGGHALLDATLPKARWTHAGHIAATAGLMLLRPGLDVDAALPGLREQAAAVARV